MLTKEVPVTEVIFNVTQHQQCNISTDHTLTSS